MVNATNLLADYALTLELEQLPAAVVRQAKTVLADTIGILMAASREHAVRTAAETFPPDGTGPCTIIGHGRGASAVGAAFVNGVGGHDIELDDSHSSSRNHAAAVIVPAALAAAEAAETCSGSDLLAAIVAAYDVQIRVSKAMGPQRQYDRGFHPTSVCGTIGATVAAGRLLGLTVMQMQSAIALAASQSSGLLTFEDDASHMIKSFHTGIAARNGLYSALLARQGFQGSPDVLTGRYNMLVPFGDPEPDIEQLTDELGSRFEICNTSIKRHACCGQTHAAVDALLDMMTTDGLAFDEISAIDVQLAHGPVPIVDDNPLWTHNIQYVMALVARERFVDHKHFSGTWTQNPELRALAEKVKVRGNDSLQSRFPAKKGAIVTVTTAKDELVRSFDAPRGSPWYPLSEDEVREKFLRMSSALVDASTAIRLWERLWAFEEQESVVEIMTP